MAALRPLARLLLTVCASAWFFPVSCTTALMVGTPLVAALDERDAAKGDEIHRSIAVTAVPASNAGRAFDYLLLGNVAYYRERNPQASFLMPAKEGSLVTDHESIKVSYKVVGEGPGEQTIETEYQDGDRQAWGRYRATKGSIAPLASRTFDSWHMFQAMPYALGISLVLYFGAGFAKRRLQRAA